MDGRYPTDTDFDFSSTNFGADSIFLSSDDPMFQRSNPHSWNPAVGMVVVIGVKSLQEEEAEFSLVMNGPHYAEYKITQLTTNLAESYAVQADETRSPDNPYVMVFKWYNWGHGNFRTEVKTLIGSANVYMNQISETNY